MIKRQMMFGLMGMSNSWAMPYKHNFGKKKILPENVVAFRD